MGRLHELVDGFHHSRTRRCLPDIWRLVLPRLALNRFSSMAWRSLPRSPGPPAPSESFPAASPPAHLPGRAAPVRPGRPWPAGTGSASSHACAAWRRALSQAAVGYVFFRLAVCRRDLNLAICSRLPECQIRRLSGQLRRPFRPRWPGFGNPGQAVGRSLTNCSLPASRRICQSGGSGWRLGASPRSGWPGRKVWPVGRIIPRHIGQAGRRRRDRRPP